ncbi:MAG: hypothetical protein IJU91_02620 [Selenomonadaceae bacterium]|nr:hypothetical protein [Selenomonadaceae bacterium]
MKKKKRKKLRDKFTDALGEEMTARNLNEKIREQGTGKREQSLEFDATKKPPAVTAEVAENIASDTSVVQTAEVQVTSEVEIKSAAEVEVKTVAEVKATTEVKPTAEVKVKTAVEVVEVKTDTEFDKRVFAEADNTFHDEKPRKPRRKLTPDETANARAAYRAKMIRDTVADEKEIYFEDKKNIDKDADLYRKLTRVETAGVALSAAMLFYAFATLDKPLFFMSLSLLSNLLRPIIGGFFGKHNRSVQNALHGFSIVLFFGALLFIFV